MKRIGDPNTSYMKTEFFMPHLVNIHNAINDAYQGVGVVFRPEDQGIRILLDGKTLVKATFWHEDLLGRVNRLWPNGLWTVEVDEAYIAFYCEALQGLTDALDARQKALEAQ